MGESVIVTLTVYHSREKADSPEKGGALDRMMAAAGVEEIPEDRIGRFTGCCPVPRKGTQSL
ncbi:hypothetical protein [Acetobacter aceti]|uniref:Uncharacterized protein n=1 Tax=Acetobacter aceti TaxID=435 RepID=A0A6S6PLZ9_ACEAC|nr:hypothetical protein [Acetobacter aceti]BCI68878.1 hypothetical protein AAJCM20276_35020 [Acetobacter aceti]